MQHYNKGSNVLYVIIEAKLLHTQVLSLFTVICCIKTALKFKLNFIVTCIKNTMKYNATMLWLSAITTPLLN